MSRIIVVLALARRVETDVRRQAQTAQSKLQPDAIGSALSRGQESASISSTAMKKTFGLGLCSVALIFCLAANGADLPENQWEIFYALLRLLFRAQAVTEFLCGDATPAADLRE